MTVKREGNCWKEPLFLIIFIAMLALSIYLVYRFYITYTANQANSASYTPELANIVIFGQRLPGLLPASLQAVDTESSAYSTIISDILIISGALLGFYSLIAIEIIKATTKYITEIKKNYHGFDKTIKTRIIINVFLVLFLIIAVYVILLVSIIDAAHAAVYQGYISTVACERATTLMEANLAMHNMTSGQIDCEGIPTFLEVGSSSPQFNQSISVQLEDESGSETLYEQLLFADAKNAGNMLEATILMLSLLIITYTITLLFKDSGADK